MSTTTTSGTLFKPELVTEMFNKVKGHSTLAKLCGAKPMPFSGTDTFVFTMDGEVAIVGEGQNKPAGKAAFSTVTIKPIKVVYQHRVTDEFVHLSEEKQLPYMQAFSDGFAKKIARGLDIMSFHGVNPADKTAATSIIGSNHFDALVTQTVDFDETAPDDCIDAAVRPIVDADGTITGIAMAPSFGAALGAMKEADSHVAMYPEFRFGANPAAFGAMASDINPTVSFGDSTDRAIVGDFTNAFRWGFADRVPMEIIQFGDPDGQGDLKRTNQIVLRAEAYIGWGILDPASFTRIVEA